MLNTAEGGGCIACNEELHRRLQMIRFFGYNEQKDVEIDGFNGKMTEVHAAIGLANLKLLTAALEDRREKYALQSHSFAKTKSYVSKNRRHMQLQLLSCRLFQRQELLHIQEALLKENIVPRRYFYPSLNTLYLP